MQYKQGFYWQGLGSCDRVWYVYCEGLENGQETRDKGISFSGFCCLGYIVFFQFLEVSVQEEGLVFYKLVGDFVDFYRFLSFFVIVSLVLRNKTVVLVLGGSLGQCGEWKLGFKRFSLGFDLDIYEYV